MREFFEKFEAIIAAYVEYLKAVFAYWEAK